MNEEQFNLVKELGFKSGYLFDNNLTPETTIVVKRYDCCGGDFDLSISLDSKEVNINTPYNRWWCSSWTLQEFTKDMERFQTELKTDIQKLRKAGIIS